jgi:drug/metabolite transporter (DMT)-like permease
VYFKKYGERISITWAVAAQFAIGGVFLMGFGFLLEPVSAVDLTGIFVASLLYVAVAGTALAWVLWLGLVRAGEASRVAAYVFFVPLISILIGVLFLNEALSLWLLAGATLIVLGTYLVNRKQPAIG